MSISRYLTSVCNYIIHNGRDSKKILALAFVQNQRHLYQYPEPNHQGK